MKRYLVIHGDEYLLVLVRDIGDPVLYAKERNSSIV
jgi:hypothetical protein